MQWFEDETMWAPLSEAFFSAKRANEAAETVAASPLLDVPVGSAVLDLGCGPGTYAIPLAGRGALVTGVDLSEAMVDRARAKALEADVDVRLLRADMRDFVEPDAFHLAISMYTSFGFFADDDDDMQVLRNVLTSLVPGGQLVLDLYGKENIARDGPTPKVFDVDSGTVIEHHTILNDWARLRLDFVVVQGDKAQRGSVVHRLYSATELKAMLDETGFVDIECFGDFDASPYDIHARRLIATGKRRP